MKIKTRKRASHHHGNRPAEILLGLGLGLGFLTSLRFAGPVGVPEILVALGFVALVWRRPRGGIHVRSGFEEGIKLYLLLSVLVVLPITTGITLLDGSYAEGAAPLYILSFVLGLGLALWLQDAMAKNVIDMRALTLWFSLAFVLANFAAIFIFGYGTDSPGAGRYTGGAKNPNQLTFYAATLSLLLVVYNTRLAILMFPVIVFFILKAKSDAYSFGLFVIAASYVFFRVVFSFPFSFGLKIGVSVAAVGVLIVLALTMFADPLHQLWLSADEGDSRTSLMINAFYATLQSPLVGWGAGSFSGTFRPFGGSEAHNTFLDFSMQFGFGFPLVLYGIMMLALVQLLRHRRFLVAAFVVGFIESGLFHFSGRHFTFWVELAVFMNYVFAGRQLRRSVDPQRAMEFKGG